jgi:tetratricopeptide (TPR) repeat protein
MLDRFDNEWRWFHNRLDSPWYPRLRTFRQQRFGEWDAPIAALLAELPAVPASDCARPATLVDIQNLHAQGIAEYRSGRIDAAIQLLAEAIARGGDAALLHSDLGEMCRQRGRLDEAIGYGERAVALDPRLPATHSNLGIALFDRGDLARAESCQRRALELAPQFVPALNNLGSICRERGDLAAALAWYDRVLAAAPDHVEALSNRGAVLTEQGRPTEALAPLLRAFELAPRQVETMCNLGLAYNALHRLIEARATLEQALQIRPNAFHALLGMAAIHLEENQPGAAEIVARRAIDAAPAHIEGYVKLGLALAALERSQEAEAAYARALDIDPANEDAQVALAHLRLEQGRSTEAVTALERLIAKNPNHMGARFHLAQAQKVRLDDANFAALRQIDAASGTMLDEDKAISLHFALGKCFDDTAQYADAFAHYLEGNRRKRATLRYDAAANTRQAEAIKRFFTAGKLRQLSVSEQPVLERSTFEQRGSGPLRVQPIFVLGMPRSGTTLVEQILSSHPAVHGAGELDEMLAIAQRQAGEPSAPGKPAPYPDNLRHATAQTLALWGAEYLNHLQQRAPGASRVTDKMPANFHALGLIHAMLPGARIIHVQRNPLDTCLSNFMQLFNTKQQHSYDLAELGGYYADYEKLMAHWRDVMPAGSFIDVRYEDVVDDIEGQTRRLLDYCGLAWSDACIDFHRNTRQIRTASLAQVRQPLYRGSIGRWRHYEHFLEPLRTALEG